MTTDIANNTTSISTMNNHIPVGSIPVDSKHKVASAAPIPMKPPSLVSICENAASLVDKYLNSNEDDSPHRLSGQKQVRLSISIVEEVLQNHDLSEIALSFNGGKDCLVMLIIFLATLHYNYKKSNYTQPPLHNIKTLPSVYVHSESSFKEVDEFVQDCSIKYALESVCLQMGMKQAFEKYLGDQPDIKTILVGIRRADPYGEQLNYIQRTDHGWPDFLRVHPVLEWHFVEVWDFLRYLQIPYCILYDQGYTSLGGTNNTAKNPYLETGAVGKDGRPLYRPAYDLTDDDKERSGRLQ